MNTDFRSGVVAFLSAQKRGIADVSDLHRNLDAVIDTMVFDGVLRRVGDGKTVEFVTEKSVQTASLRKKKGDYEESVSAKRTIALTQTEYLIYSFVRSTREGVLPLQALRERSLNAGVSEDEFNACLGSLCGKEALLWSAATNSYKADSRNLIQVVGSRVEKKVLVVTPPPKPVQKSFSSKEIGNAVVKVFERRGGTVAFPTLIQDLVSEKVLVDDKPTSQVVVAKKLRDMKDERSRPLFCLAVEDIGQWNKVVYSSDKQLPEEFVSSAIPMNTEAEVELKKIKEKQTVAKRVREKSVKIVKPQVLPAPQKEKHLSELLIDERVFRLMDFLMKKLLDTVSKRAMLYELESLDLIDIGDIPAVERSIEQLVRHKVLTTEDSKVYDIQREALNGFRAVVDSLGFKSNAQSKKKKLK